MFERGGKVFIKKRNSKSVHFVKCVDKRVWACYNKRVQEKYFEVFI